MPESRWDPRSPEWELRQHHHDEHHKAGGAGSSHHFHPHVRRRCGTDVHTARHAKCTGCPESCSETQRSVRGRIAGSASPPLLSACSARLCMLINRVALRPLSESRTSNTSLDAWFICFSTMFRSDLERQKPTWNLEPKTCSPRKEVPIQAKTREVPGAQEMQHWWVSLCHYSLGLGAQAQTPACPTPSPLAESIISNRSGRSYSYKQGLHRCLLQRKKLWLAAPNKSIEQECKLGIEG